MQKIFLFISLILSFSVYAQKGKFKPFKLVVISVDTVIIDSSVISFVDKVEQDHLKSYYYSLAQLEQMANDTIEYPEDLITKKEAKKVKQDAKEQLASAKAYESKVKEFKYYQSISEYSLQAYEYYFNEYPPLSTFQLIDKENIELKNLSRIADSLKADYVVGYKNIHTEINDGQDIIKLTTILYSRKGNNILLEKETTGDMNSYGDMWTCSNPLSCLLITAVKSSTESVYPIIAQRQVK